MCSFVEICKEAVLDKYGCSTRKHVEDGVCLPAMEEFLSRHVSRRYIHRVRIAVHFLCCLVAVCVSPLYTEYTFCFALYKSLFFFHFIDYSHIFYFSIYFFYRSFFILCGVILSVWLW